MESLEFIWWVLVHVSGISFSVFGRRLSLLVHVSGLSDYCGMSAGALVTTRFIVLMDDELKSKLPMRVYPQVVRHEISHLMRGVVTPCLCEVHDLFSIAQLYYVEEQIINLVVAPDLHKLELKTWKQVGYEKYVLGGLYMLGDRPLYRERVISIIEMERVEINKKGGKINPLWIDHLDMLKAVG